MRKDTILFREYAIDAGATVSFEKKIVATCMTKKITLNFYRGQELKLKVKPFIWRRNGLYEPLMTFADDTDFYLAGDAEYQEFSVEKPLYKDDRIVMEVENTDTAAASLIADIEIEYRK